MDIRTCRRCGKVFQGVSRRVALALRLHEQADHAGAPAPSETEAHGAMNAAIETLIAQSGGLATTAKVAGPRLQGRIMARSKFSPEAVGMQRALAERYASDEPQLDGEDAPDLHA